MSNGRPAMELLAGMYFFGEGVPENNVDAMRWFRIAAEQEHSNAQYYLGWLYPARRRRHFEGLRAGAVMVSEGGRGESCLCSAQSRSNVLLRLEVFPRITPSQRVGFGSLPSRDMPMRRTILA